MGRRKRLPYGHFGIQEALNRGGIELVSYKDLT